MADTKQQQTALGDVAARQLAIATRTVPQMVTITPRWLTRLLHWVPVESGVYRLNKVKNATHIEVDCSSRDEKVLPQTFVDYIENPREYNLAAVQTIVDVHTRVSDLYSKPYNQISEQLRLAIETIKERQESELINNTGYGLLHSVSDDQRIKTRTGAPTPDDLDELITKVWKEPGFFLLHPAAIAAFWKRVYAQGCAATNNIVTGIAVLNLERNTADPLGQTAYCKGQIKDNIIADRRNPPGCRELVSARTAGRADSRTFGAFYGH